MRLRSLWLITLAGLALTGCGPRIGSYEVVDLAVVDDLPAAARATRPPEPYLRIHLRSTFDLVGDTNGNVYGYKIGCGMFDREERMVFGPFAGGLGEFDLYDMEPTMPSDQDGRADYAMFVPLSAPSEPAYPGGERIDPAYDLRAGPENLCLRIEQAGYFLTASQSEMIEIDREDLARLFYR